MVKINSIAIGVIMVVAMLWSTQRDQFGSILETINKIPTAFALAVTTVFVLGVLWKGAAPANALTTLYIGSLIGIAYFLNDMPATGK